MNKQLLLGGLFMFVLKSFSQITDPMITSWWFNTNNLTYTGTNGTFTVNVNAVYYTTTKVYVKSSGVPSYYADGASNFDADDQSHIYAISRTPTVATSANRSGGTAYANVGTTLDGALILNPGDGKSYSNQGVWHQLAYSFEGLDFDSYNGHSTPQGVYHHHVDPNSLYTGGGTTHSPIIGYAFDGYPIYGPYAYTNTNGTGAIKRMTTSWQVRNITARTTLPSGATASSAGPCVGMPPSCQPLGKYWEDYEYVSGVGDLDRYNGRFCKTPEYPSGTYAYFVTLDASLKPAFPYIVGDSLYGVANNTTNGVIPGSATHYTTTVTGINTVFETINISIFPNPVVKELNIKTADSKKHKVVLYNSTGAIIETKQMDGSSKIDMTNYAQGIYIVEVIDEESGNGYMQRIIKSK